jgi:putative hydroxymethylpyrimidine transport system permease protein
MTDITRLITTTSPHQQRHRQRELATPIRLLISISVLLGLWQLTVVAFNLPSFILPPPLDVAQRLITRYDVLLSNTWVTAQEIILGLILGLSLGLLIASQAIPVFAIAPVLMLWLGYGIGSKVVMAALIIFFPVTTCCYDGLRNTPSGYLELSATMGATKWQQLRYIRFPAALPALASGIRVAVVIAPIGAVAGEWVGASQGLGYLMLQANARMMIDEMFAALFILSLLSVSLYFITDKLLKRFIPWQL